MPGCPFAPIAPHWESEYSEPATPRLIRHYETDWCRSGGRRLFQNQPSEIQRLCTPRLHYLYTCRQLWAWCGKERKVNSNGYPRFNLLFSVNSVAAGHRDNMGARHDVATIYKKPCSGYLV